MSDPYDEIPLPSEGVLSEEESARQLREDCCRQYVLEIKRLSAKVESLEAEADKEHAKAVELSEKLIDARNKLAECEKVLVKSRATFESGNGIEEWLSPDFTNEIAALDNVLAELMK